MKIWIDLRFLQEEDLYSLFVFSIVQELIKNTKHEFIIYSDTWFEDDLWMAKTEIVEEKIWSIGENFSLIKKIKKQNFDLMIFFNEYKPLSYTDDYVLVIPSLQRLFFGPFKNSLAKHYYLKLLSSNINHAKKIICLDKKTKSDLNERFNIEEDKIEIIKGFFPIREAILIEDNDLNIKNKHALTWDYILYDSEESSIKNLDKVLNSIKKLKEANQILNLIILWEDAWKNLEFRKMVVDYGINDLVFFVWEVDNAQRQNYYRQSVGLVYPNIYETFPFELNNALIYWTPMIVSDLEVIKEATLWELEYFNALSNMDTLEALKTFLKKKKNPNYKKILDYNTPLKCSNEMLDIIDNKLD